VFASSVDARGVTIGGNIEAYAVNGTQGGTVLIHTPASSMTVGSIDAGAYGSGIGGKVYFTSGSSILVDTANGTALGVSGISTQGFAGGGTLMLSSMTY